MNAITDYSHYVTEMEKGIQDKLFFMEKIKFSTLLDYGCADGMLIETMAHYYPHKKYIGYDFDKNMVSLAKAKGIKNSSFYNNLHLANEKLTSGNGKTAILCSSLIHEVYSYGTDFEIGLFWENLFSGVYDYIVIRDMALSENIESEKTDKHDIEKLMQKANIKSINEFEENWGSIENKKNFIHFLMKYRYTKNWSREVKENYFPITVQEHLMKIPDNFEIILFEHFSLPFQRDVIENDFGINMEEKTHVKIILKKK